MNDSGKSGANWSHDETVLAMDLYSRIPFGQCTQRNESVRLLAQKIGRSASSVARKLGNLGRFDPALQARGVSGLVHGSKMDEIVWRQAHANWSEFVAEATKIEKKFDFEPPIIPEPVIADKPTERFIAGKARIGQRFFRSAVLGSYRSECSMCALDEQRLIVASHISAWALDKANRLNPRNGIALCVLHDAAFDGKFVTLDAKFRWTFLPTLKKRFDSTPYKEFFAPYEGAGMRMPDRWHPDPVFVNSHRKSCLGE